MIGMFGHLKAFFRLSFLLNIQVQIELRPHFTICCVLGVFLEQRCRCCALCLSKLLSARDKRHRADPCRVVILQSQDLANHLLRRKESLLLLSRLVTSTLSDKASALVTFSGLLDSFSGPNPIQQFQNYFCKLTLKKLRHPSWNCHNYLVQIFS